MGTPAFSVYSASKAAIRSFARCWILELASRRIRVNVLVPGATSTPGWHGLAASEEQDRQMQMLSSAATPLGRLGTPEETASAALFLASGEDQGSRIVDLNWRPIANGTLSHPPYGNADLSAESFRFENARPDRQFICTWMGAA